MKRHLFLLLAALAAAPALRAQEETFFVPPKGFWLDFQAAQSIRLGAWNDFDPAADGFPGRSMTELRAVANFRLVNPSKLNLFADMGLGVMSASPMDEFRLEGLPVPNANEHYFLRDIRSESGTGRASAHFRVTVGLSSEFRLDERWSVLPALGVGGMAMPQRRFETVLKEEGSNNQYEADYAWGGSGLEDWGSTMPGLWTARLHFRRPIGRGTSLLVGMEYTQLFNTVDFHSRFIHSFNSDVRRELSAYGNKVGFLGISAGISFR